MDNNNLHQMYATLRETTADIANELEMIATSISATKSLLCVLDCVAQDLRRSLTD